MVSEDFVTSDWHFAHPYVAAFRYFQKVNMTAAPIQYFVDLDKERKSENL